MGTTEEASSDFIEFIKMTDPDPLQFLQMKFTESFSSTPDMTPTSNFRDLLGIKNLKGIKKTDIEDCLFTPSIIGPDVWDVPVHPDVSCHCSFFPKNSFIPEELIIPLGFIIDNYDPEFHVRMEFEDASEIIRNVLLISKSSAYQTHYTKMNKTIPSHQSFSLVQSLILMISISHPIITQPEILTLVRYIPTTEYKWKCFIKNLIDYIRKPKYRVGFHNPKPKSKANADVILYCESNTCHIIDAAKLRKEAWENVVQPATLGLRSLYKKKLSHWIPTPCLPHKLDSKNIPQNYLCNN